MAAEDTKPDVPDEPANSAPAARTPPVAVCGAFSIAAPFFGIVTCGFSVVAHETPPGKLDLLGGLEFGFGSFLFLCLLGLILAAASRSRREEPRAVGFIGFLLNMVPLAFVAIEQMALFFTHLM